MLFLIILLIDFSNKENKLNEGDIKYYIILNNSNYTFNNKFIEKIKIELINS